LHGTHQEAQKLRRTTFPCSDESLSFPPPSRRDSSKSGDAGA
jgi:hypothetical protein